MLEIDIWGCQQVSSRVCVYIERGAGALSTQRWGRQEGTSQGDQDQCRENSWERWCQEDSVSGRRWDPPAANRSRKWRPQTSGISGM